MRYSQLSVKVLPRTQYTMFKLEKNSRSTPASKVVCWVRGGEGRDWACAILKKSDKCKIVPRLSSMIEDSSKFVFEGQRGIFLAIFPRHNDGT